MAKTYFTSYSCESINGFDTFTMALNTVIANGSPYVTLAAYIHGWEELLELLRSEPISPLVMSYSVTGGFPDTNLFTDNEDEADRLLETLTKEDI